MSAVAGLRERELRDSAAACARIWGEHRRACPDCNAYAQRGQWGALCDAGKRARRQLTAAQAALGEERRLAALPNPHQGGLFDGWPA